uniref:Uncharacterized protein n=1 Tax=Oryza brachyantha TaxID=4533 RepID=J3M0C4_ORYBR
RIVLAFMLVPLQVYHNNLTYITPAKFAARFQKLKFTTRYLEREIKGSVFIL